MPVTLPILINIVLCALEFIAVASLWVWFAVDLHRLGGTFKKATTQYTEAYPENPNRDVDDAISQLESRAATMLPLTGTVASLDVLFSTTVISYFTLLPLLASLICYYTVITGTVGSFLLAASREEALKHYSSSLIIKRDEKGRKRSLKIFVNKYRAHLVGHLNFLVAIISFVVATVISKSFHPSTTALIFVMMHTLLLSYLVAFLLELLFFKHRRNTTQLGTDSD